MATFGGKVQCTLYYVVNSVKMCDLMEGLSSVKCKHVFLVAVRDGITTQRNFRTYILYCTALLTVILGSGRRGGGGSFGNKFEITEF